MKRAFFVLPFLAILVVALVWALNAAEAVRRIREDVGIKEVTEVFPVTEETRRVLQEEAPR